MDPGAVLTLDIEKPVAGGRMLARHEGQVVLVSGAVPGERVRARVERAGRGVLYADTAEVLSASSDRRAAPQDWRCGGSVYAHVAYDRQVRLKAEVIRDALGRVGRVLLPYDPAVLASPEQGYRMRARFHVRGGRIGFFREGTHELCDPARTGQLLPATLEWVAEVERFLHDERPGGVLSIELAENIPADERACHLELQAGVEAGAFARLAGLPGMTGVSATRADRRGVELVAGTAQVVDVLHPRSPVANGGGVQTALRLRRSARSFFQGNRYLLEPLVRHVVADVPQGPVVDLYAGVGLFGLALAAASTGPVTLVEDNPASGADLRDNAAPFGEDVSVARQSVEAYLRQEAGTGTPTTATYVVDPPRTGMSKAAMAGIVAARPARLVYVSCDVATLARDTRTLLDAGYALEGLNGFDLFPNTAHVEVVGVFAAASGAGSAGGGHDRRT